MTKILWITLLIFFQPIPSEAGVLKFCQILMVKLGVLNPLAPKMPEGIGYPNRFLEKDVRDNVLVYSGKEWVYLNNPTRIEIDRSIKTRDGEQVIDLDYLDFPGTDKNAEVLVMYVITLDGKLILGKEVSPSIFTSYEGRIKKMPHSTLASADGEIRRVLGAGEVVIKKGKIFRVNNSSGHFPSGSEVIPLISRTLEKYRRLFHPDYHGVEDVSNPPSQRAK